MSRHVRRSFVQPFVITLAACGGAKAPQPVIDPTAPSAPEPVDRAAPPIDAGPVAVVTPDATAAALEATPVVGNVNPPPPQPRASRDLKWRIKRVGTGEAAKCSAQQLEACATAKPACKPPIETTLCVLEDLGTPASWHKYPLVVEQKQGDTNCYIVGTKPPEQTYCPNEWMIPKK